MRKIKFHPPNLKRLTQRSKYTQKAGMAPGSMIYTGTKSQEVVLQLIVYDSNEIAEYESKDFKEIIGHMDPNKTNWINFDGIGNVELMTSVSEYFNFHPLMAEDILNTDHLPKSEEYEEHFFFTTKMLRLREDNQLNTKREKTNFIQEHISLVLGKHYVLSFQDDLEGDVFDGVRSRLRSGKGRIRAKNADYLFYALLDSVVDNYFFIMEDIREHIELMEDFILENPHINMTNEIINTKKQLTTIRRIFFPLTSAVDKIFADEPDLIDESIYPFLNDIKDHVVHLGTSFEGFKESVTSLMDMYMSNLSNNMNAVMKTLTIFSMFFVPLTFLAGIYGMNFEYMPELGWEYGYYMIWGIMITTVILMFIYLKRKKWI